MVIYQASFPIQQQMNGWITYQVDVPNKMTGSDDQLLDDHLQACVP